MSTSEKQQELLTVYERHHNALPKDDIDGVPAPFINVYFPLNGSIETYFQFSWGMYNATQLDEERKAAFKRVVEAEKLELENEETDWAMAADYKWTPEEAVRVTDRILEGVYGVGFEDIGRIEEVDTVGGMARDKMEDQLGAVDEFLVEQNNVITFNVANQPFEGFEFEGQTLKAFAEMGLDTGADEVYIIENRNGSGDLDRAGVCFFISERPHTLMLESYERSASKTAERTRTEERTQYSSIYGNPMRSGHGSRRSQRNC